jgi:hypothetical protein
MCQNFLQLNNEKTEAILFGNKKDRLELTSLLSNKGLQVKTTVKNLGVQIDSDLTFNSHIKSVSKSAFYHLKNISKLRNLMTKSDLEKLIHAFISSKLDYCNGLLTGLPKKNIRQLQLIQNAAARVLMKAKRSDHVTPLLKALHWLPVSQRIDFKVLLLVFKSLTGMGPTYLVDLLQYHTPTRPLRSQDQLFLTKPTVRTKSGEAAFSFYATQLWNQLPISIRTAPSIDTFKTSIKTHLFSVAFS